MRVQYISDIHLEFLNKKEMDAFKKAFVIKADIFILAGDIGDPFKASYIDFVAFCSSSFQKVFVIAGNHEYYCHTIQGSKQQIQQVISTFSNVSFLDNDYEDYEGILWIGTTMWTNITQPQYTINDTEMIVGLSVPVYNELHQECKQFLETTLNSTETTAPIKCVVITHHMPVESLIHPAYRTPDNQDYNQRFSCTDLNEVIEQHKNKIVCWIYGHTHKASVETVNDILFVCNPIGYKYENDDDPHDTNQVVEVDVESNN